MQHLVSTPAVNEVLRSPTVNMAILNSQGDIITVNELWKQFARENGSTDQTFFVGTNYLKVCQNALNSGFNEGTEEVYKNLLSMLAGELTEFAIEYPCHSPNEQRWFLMQAVRFSIFGETVISITHENITYFKTKLQEAQTRFDNFIRSLPDAIYTLNLPERKATGINRDSFLGYSKEELMVLDALQEHIHPEDMDEITAHWKQVMLGEATDSIEYRLKNKAEQWEWIDSRKTILTCHPDGTPKELMIVLRVITDRKKAEEQIAFHARILENVNDVIIGTDEQFIITYWNPAAERTFGWKAEEVIGKNTADVLRTAFSRDGREESIRQIRSAGFWKGEVTQYTKDGEPVFIDANIMTIKDQQGRVMGYVSANRDISHRKQIEANLFQAKENMEAANLELHDALAREQTLSRTDSLTGLFNRRHFFTLAEHEFKVAKRYNGALSISVFDLDYFKHVNDRWGHQVGDEVLKNISRLVQSQLRESDILARYGGEEFILLMPNSNAKEAEQVSERIRTSINTYRIEQANTVQKITVSIGVAELTPAVESLDHLIRHADKALYDAKKAGRNCVRVYSTV
jgi:diguanylate cyclase (GGDEF)-like protein/PAS domain S-box-containing protein